MFLSEKVKSLWFKAHSWGTQSRLAEEPLANVYQQRGASILDAFRQKPALPQGNARYVFWSTRSSAVWCCFTFAELPGLSLQACGNRSR